MNSSNLAELKTQLENRRQELLSLTARAMSDGRALNEEPQDTGDRSLSTFEKELLFQQANDNRRRLRMIESALRRFQEGTYGHCLKCGEQIGSRRLKAMPFANYCLECQRELEDQRLQNRAA